MDLGTTLKVGLAAGLLAGLFLRSQFVPIKAWACGLLAFAVFSLLPLLVVPATPPAVEMVPAGEERQFWYVATLISALGGVVAGFGLYYLLSSRAKTAGVRQALLAGSAVWFPVDNDHRPPTL